jgi:hypothetical protein
MTSEEKKALLIKIREEIYKEYSAWDGEVQGILEIVERVLTQDGAK